MFKSRRKPVRKCRGNRQFTDRENGRTKKLEGISNITSKRLTIPPGFLCLGIKSETTQKSTSQENKDPQSKYILKEDLHGLHNINLNNNISKPRRSSRILKKVEEAHNLDDLTITHYYSKIFTQNGNSLDSKELQRCSDKNRLTINNNSKSLFREINKRCSVVASQNFVNLNCSVSPTISARKIELFRVSAFCKNLFKEVHIDLNQNILLNRKLAISEKIQNINNVLSGKLVSKVEMDEGGHNNKIADIERADRDETVKSFAYIPSGQWVYETPPRQRIMLPKVEECAIQPAVIYTTKKRSNIYELNPNVKIDLNNYTNRQNVEVDGRYLKHVSSVAEKMQMGFKLNSLETTSQVITDRRITNITDNYNYFQNPAEGSNAEYNFKNPFLNASENNHMPLLSRPTKTVRKVPRTNNVVKRKLEELESTPVNSNLHQNHVEGDFTFIEDNGKFKIINTQCSTDGDSFNFQFERKNLFKRCENSENLFAFRKEEPKLFDFSQLKKDGC